MKKFSDLFNIENLDPKERADFIYNLALNHSTAPETLKLLAQDTSLDVLRALAINPNTSSETLTELAEVWGGSMVRYFSTILFALTWNPNLPVGVAKILREDEKLVQAISRNKGVADMRRMLKRLDEIIEG